MATERVSRTAAGRSQARRRPRDRRHLQVVPEARRRLALRLSPRVGVILTLVLFLALFGVTVSHALLIESQARLDRLDEQVASEQDRFERLQRETAELEAPGRIIAEAEDLGMVPAENPEWLVTDRPATGDDAGEEATDDTATGWTEVKPYLEYTP